MGKLSIPAVKPLIQCHADSKWQCPDTRSGSPQFQCCVVQPSFCTRVLQPPLTLRVVSVSPEPRREAEPGAQARSLPSGAKTGQHPGLGLHPAWSQIRVITHKGAAVRISQNDFHPSPRGLLGSPKSSLACCAQQM